MLSNEMPFFEVKAVFEQRRIPEENYYTKLISEYLPVSMGGRSTYMDFNPTVHLIIEEKKEESDGDSQFQYANDDEIDSNFGMITATFVYNLDKLWLNVYPSNNEIIMAIRKCFSDGMDCLKGFERRSRNPDLDRYEAVLEDWDDRVCEEWEPPDQLYLNCEDWLRGNPLYEKREIRVKELVDSAYAKVE